MPPPRVSDERMPKFDAWLLTDIFDTPAKPPPIVDASPYLVALNDTCAVPYTCTWASATAGAASAVATAIPRTFFCIASPLCNSLDPAPRAKDALPGQLPSSRSPDECAKRPLPLPRKAAADRKKTDRLLQVRNTARIRAATQQAI